MFVDKREILRCFSALGGFQIILARSQLQTRVEAHLGYDLILHSELTVVVACEEERGRNFIGELDLEREFGTPCWGLAFWELMYDVLHPVENSL